MFTKIDTPPDYQVWADQSYIKIQQHLKAKSIPFSEDLTLDWIAAPYFSLWKGKNKEGKIWVLHNDLATDAFVDDGIVETRQALALFSLRWEKTEELDILSDFSADPAISEINLKANLASMGSLLQRTVDDQELWEEE